jgi:hypothetical protein
MKTTLHFHDVPLDGDERLMDALLREHARAGTGTDAAFLTRLAAALAAEATESDRVVTLPARPASKRPWHRLAWSLGLAASVALAAGLMWKYPHAGKAADTQVAVQAHGGGIALHTEFPPELIEGTPKAIDVPNLAPVPERAPVFFVPQGTALLSKGKPVTSSDNNPIIGALDLITDGDKQAGEGYFVELLDGLQWVQIDLEKRAAINAIWVWHYHSQKRAYHDVIVQISDDPGFKTGVTTVYNNDYDNSAKFGKGPDNPYVESRFGIIANGKGTHGRYIRLYSNGNSSNEMNHYIEVEVFGTPD